MYSSEGYEALTRGCGLVRRRDRGVLTVKGPDRLVWLQGLLTNDVLALQPGQSCYAAYLTPQGRMISDLRVVQRSGDTLLEVPGVLAEGLRARLDGLLFAEDAQIVDSSKEIDVIDVHGPDAPTLMSLASDAIRDDIYGVPGVTFFVRGGDALVARLVSAGAVETTLETLDVLRVEAGRPLFLVDMDEHTIPLEAGIEDRAISFTKGCYVGQEVIVRVTQRGQGRVAKKLVSLIFDTGATSRSGDSVRSGGRDIGRITSAVWSPAAERFIALGYVHRDFTASGTPVDVVTSDGVARAVVR